MVKVGGIPYELRDETIVRGAMAPIHVVTGEFTGEAEGKPFAQMGEGAQ